jgi:hypothetical protein
MSVAAPEDKPYNERRHVPHAGRIDSLGWEVLIRGCGFRPGGLCYTGLPGFDSLRPDLRFAELMTRLALSRA